ncbi:MAG: 3'-5' exonuclease [Spirochaetaceae bacterium]|nr:3'-5' exonuclease [Spirochaetaceae bacterium]
MYARRFWVDTETTGLDTKRHFAFQISYLIEEDNVILHRRTLEARPERYDLYEFSKDAEDVHGYSRDKIISLQPEAAAFAVLLDDLKQYGGKRLTLAGYNISFDIRFLKALFDRNKAATGQYSVFYKYFDYMYFDILQFVQAYRIAGIINLQHIDLESICRYFGINTKDAHNSMTDILNTKSVFDKMAGMIDRQSGFEFEIRL